MNLQPLGEDTIRISWGTGSGVDISPSSILDFDGFALQAFSDKWDEKKHYWPLPPLSPQSGVWMYTVNLKRMGAANPAHFVNPKLDDAMEKMFRMLALGIQGEENTELLTRLAAQSYVYLGYVVLNEEDVSALVDALEDRAQFDFDQDIVTSERTLYKLRVGVERQFVGDTSEVASLAAMRRQIPVMFESMNLKAGHPGDVMHVLYLDGHVEAIPFGERFPATMSFMTAFPPASVPEPKRQ